MPAPRWLLTAAFLILLVSAGAAEEVTKDGETWIVNGETPRDGTLTIEPEFLWERGDDSDEVFFGVVPRVMVDGTGELYVLDSQLHVINVFDNSGEWVRAIGREGEGPGEFRNPGDMFFSPDGSIGVMQVFPGRVVRLKKDGEPGAAFDPGPYEGFKVFHLSFGLADRVVISGTTYSGGAQGGTQTDFVRAFDVGGKQVAEYAAKTSPTQFGGMTFREAEFNSFVRRFAVAEDGRVAVGMNFADYRIHMYDTAGTLLYVIDRPGFEPVRRTGEEKARFQRLYDAITSWNQGSTFEVSDVHQSIGQMGFHPDGSLWVMSSVDYWRSGDGLMGSWDVYSPKGEFLRRVTMRGDGTPSEDYYFFAGDRMYQVTDLFSAAMSQLGGDEESANDDEAEPVRLVAWKIGAPLARN